MSHLVTPTVNLNGSSKHDLVGQMLTIMRALEDAEHAICHAMPHGRDFQTMDAESYRAAREAFCERARAVHAMCAEFGELAIAINAQDGR